MASKKKIKTKSEELKQTAFRLEPKALSALDDVVRKREQETGMRLNRTDVLRWLIRQAARES